MSLLAEWPWASLIILELRELNVFIRLRHKTGFSYVLDSHGGGGGIRKQRTDIKK